MKRGLGKLVLVCLVILRVISENEKENTQMLKSKRGKEQQMEIIELME